MYRLTSILLALAFPCVCLGQAPAPAPVGNLLKSGEFEKFQRTYNPWGGVDGQNYLRTFEARAGVVTSSGNTANTAFPCTPCPVDFNNDGLIDIVAVDADGYTWYYPNSGTKTEPKYTSAEIVPIMLSSGYLRGGPGTQCPGMIAVDYDDSGKYSLVYGDWLGNVYFAPNLGSKQIPKFVQPKQTKDYTVATSIKGDLWGNYFFPAVYDWDGDGRKDLIVGEGTYSANSIWLFLNQGNNTTPIFNQKEGKKFPLVRGLGREHLTPVIMDWNGDGLPDVITGEREGTVSVYINETPPNSKNEYKFKEPVTINFGTTSKIGALSRVTFGDVNGDGLPDAFVGRGNGRIGLALNKGTKNNPVFDTVKDILGNNPFPAYGISPDVEFRPPERSTFHLLKVVSNNKAEADTFEEGYAPPPQSKGTHSLKMEFYDTKPKVFTNPLPLPIEDAPSDEWSNNLFNTYGIRFKNGFQLIPDKEYTLSFWVRGSGFTRRLEWNIFGGESIVESKDEDGLNVTRHVWYTSAKSFNLSDTWYQVRGSVKISRKSSDKVEPPTKPIGMTLRFFYEGTGYFYLDDVTLTEGNALF
ncbi:MAG: FG-GAP repeat domain-containing protein [Candidatus Methylacidiphilales bacterium]|nr:VCBS repeat-containing protein [Candidatus Methylacidiphilales bacterium]